MIPIVAALLKLGLPLLGNAIASKGKEFIEEKTGIDVTSMLGSEEGRIKLAQAEMQHEEMLREFTIKEREQELRVTEMEYANTDSARKMQMEALKQTDLLSKQFIYYFAGLWSLASALYIVGITFFTLPPANVRFADTILGFILGTVIATILNFFFGSSKTSQAKDATIAEAIKGMK